jgi:hypothetical protein
MGRQLLLMASGTVCMVARAPGDMLLASTGGLHLCSHSSDNDTSRGDLPGVWDAGEADRHGGLCRSVLQWPADVCVSSIQWQPVKVKHHTSKEALSLNAKAW